MFSMNKSVDGQSFLQTEIVRPSGVSDGSSDGADVVKHCWFSSDSQVGFGKIFSCFLLVFIFFIFLIIVYLLCNDCIIVVTTIFFDIFETIHVVKFMLFFLVH